MMDRVHAVMDGELPREALTPAEMARLVSLEESVGRSVQALEAAAVPELAEGVLSRLPGTAVARPALVARVAAWLWAPRPISFALRPAYGFGGLAAVVLTIATLAGAPSSTPLLPPMLASMDAPRMYVQFRLEASGASRVELAGSFTEWEPEYTMDETAPGVWSVMVPLEPGVHDYTFVVDGKEWVMDPFAPRVSDSFGGSNSRLFLPPPATSA